MTNPKISVLISIYNTKKYLDKALTTPIFIKAGISHYKTVYPFLDENGRLGRLIAVFYLMSKSKLNKPVLCLPDYFAKNREKYYKALDAVCSQNDIDHRMKFFIVAVKEMSEKSCLTLQKIIDLREKNWRRIVMPGRRVPNATILINAMYSRPNLSVKDVAEITSTSLQTAHSFVNSLVELGVLYETAGFARNRIYLYKDYTELFNE